MTDREYNDLRDRMRSLRSKIEDDKKAIAQAAPAEPVGEQTGARTASAGESAEAEKDADKRSANTTGHKVSKRAIDDNDKEAKEKDNTDTETKSDGSAPSEPVVTGAQYVPDADPAPEGFDVSEAPPEPAAPPDAATHTGRRNDKAKKKKSNKQNKQKEVSFADAGAPDPDWPKSPPAADENDSAPRNAGNEKNEKKAKRKDRTPSAAAPPPVSPKRLRPAGTVFLLFSAVSSAILAVIPLINALPDPPKSLLRIVLAAAFWLLLIGAYALLLGCKLRYGRQLRSVLPAQSSALYRCYCFFGIFNFFRNKTAQIIDLIFLAVAVLIIILSAVKYNGYFFFFFSAVLLMLFHLHNYVNDTIFAYTQQFKKDVKHDE